ncbi:UNVERIFIED_CONTAM: hypothetical protein FKN15_035590 [Acipenser sinensis]
MVLLDANAKQNLLNFTNTGIVSINYEAYLAELNKGVTKVNLLSFANDLEDQADKLNKVNNVIGALDAAQRLINSNGSLIIAQETEKYMEMMIGYFKQYIDWVKNSIIMEVAACKPIANVVDTAEILTCSFVADSLWVSGDYLEIPGLQLPVPADHRSCHGAL